MCYVQTIFSMQIILLYVADQPKFCCLFSFIFLTALLTVFVTFAGLLESGYYCLSSNLATASITTTRATLMPSLLRAVAIDGALRPHYRKKYFVFSCAWCVAIFCSVQTIRQKCLIQTKPTHNYFKLCFSMLKIVCTWHMLVGVAHACGHGTCLWAWHMLVGVAHACGRGYSSVGNFHSIVFLSILGNFFQ